MNYQQPAVQQPKWTPEQYAERRALQNSGNAIGLALIIMQAIAFVVVFIIQMAITIIYGQQKLMEIVNDSMFKTMLQVYLSVLVMTIPFLIAAKMMRFKSGQLMSFKKVEKGLFVPLVLMALGIGFLGNFATSYLDQIMSAFGQPAQGIEMEMPKNVFGEIAFTMAIVVFAPLVEEFAFRGVVLGSLRRFGDGFAIFVSAALFGLIHGNLVQIPFAFIGGLIMGYITVASGSIWPAIIVHFINNSASVLVSDFAGELGSAEYELLNNGLSLFFIFFGLIGAVLYLKRNPSGFRLLKSPTKLSGRGKLAAFVATPGMIIAIVILGLSVVMVQIGLV